MQGLASIVRTIILVGALTIMGIYVMSVFVTEILSLNLSAEATTAINDVWGKLLSSFGFIPLVITISILSLLLVVLYRAFGGGTR